jgi:transcriptional regulator with GAF, ATPase, and Fis domain
MSQEVEILNISRNSPNLNQIEALKSLSQLLTREISSLESTPETIYRQIADGRKICLQEELQKFEIVLIRCALICTMGRQNAAAGLLGLKNSTLNEKIKRLKINMLESI